MTEEDSTSSVVSTSGAALPSTSLSNSTMYHLRLPAEEVVRIATVVAGLVHPTNTLLSASKNPLMFPGASFGIASSNSTVTSTLSTPMLRPETRLPYHPPWSALHLQVLYIM